MRSASQIERVLVYRLGSLGDTLLALPAFHLIRKRFPRAKVTLLTHVPTGTKAAPLVSILQHTDLFQDLISYPLRLRSIGQLRSLREQIASRRFDLGIYLAEDRGPAKSLRDFFFLRACGISRLIGLPWRCCSAPILGRSNVRHYTDAELLPRAVPTAACFAQERARSENGSHMQPPRGWAEWEAESLVRRLASLGSVDLDQEMWWDLRLTDQERQVAGDLLAPIDSPFIAASLGTKVEVKHWTEPNWRSLFDQMHKRWPELSLVLLGSDDEFLPCERCSQTWLAPKLNLCGLVPPRVSAAILRKARLFIGHDSGPLHLAATVGTPCVGIYSARDPAGRWFPRGNQNLVIYHQTPCFGCGLEICVKHQKECILSITVEEVLQAVQHQLLSANRPSPQSASNPTAGSSGAPSPGGEGWGEGEPLFPPDFKSVGAPQANHHVRHRP
jgi:ADP-heptose:LPS heptosyltransferase